MDAKRRKLLETLETIEGAAPSTVAAVRVLIRRAKPEQLAAIARVVASMARAATRYAPARREAAKRNPQLLTLGNPGKATGAELERARAAYRRFHGVDVKPGLVKRGKGKGVLIVLGELRRVDYQPTRGQRRGPVWFHHFGKGCKLATDPAGKRLVILDTKGEQLVDFDRGIVR